MFDRNIASVFVRASGAALLFGSALMPFSTLAQTASQNQKDPPAVVGKITVGQQVASDNGKIVGITPIELSYKTATRSQNLVFNLSLPIWEGAEESDSLFDLREPQALLHYRRFTKNASFEVKFSYREADLDREVFFDQLNEQIVTSDQGRVADRDAEIGYAFGNQAKIGGEFTISYYDRNYSDTTDPSLYDRTTTEGDFQVFLEPIPLIRARLLTSLSRTDSYELGTDTKQRRAGAGAAMQIDKLTKLDAELAWSDITREDHRTGEKDNAAGISLRLRADRARPDGDWSLAFASDPGTAGRRERLALGRDLESFRYDLGAELGVTRFQDNLDPIFKIRYDLGLSDISKFTASLQRDAVTNSDGDEALNTSVSAGYSQILTPTSSLAGNIRYRASEGQAGDIEDSETIALDINYTRDLTQDTNLVAGVNLIRGQSDDDAEETDDERIYLGINRDFDFLP